MHDAVGRQRRVDRRGGVCSRCCIAEGIGVSRSGDCCRQAARGVVDRGTGETDRVRKGGSLHSARHRGIGQAGNRAASERGIGGVRVVVDVCRPEDLAGSVRAVRGLDIARQRTRVEIDHATVHASDCAERKRIRIPGNIDNFHARPNRQTIDGLRGAGHGGIVGKRASILRGHRGLCAQSARQRQDAGIDRGAPGITAGAGQREVARSEPNVIRIDNQPRGNGTGIAEIAGNGQCAGGHSRLVAAATKLVRAIVGAGPRRNGTAVGVVPLRAQTHVG